MWAKGLKETLVLRDEIGLKKRVGWYNRMWLLEWYTVLLLPATPSLD